MLMHPATMRQPQDDPQWLEARRADPAYQGWAEKRHAADAMQFDAWLETPEGQNWLDGEAERYEPDRSYGWSWEH